MAAVGKLVLERHTALMRLGEPGVPTQYDLDFHESEIIRLAMASLRAKDIPSLPVHDSLLVPLSSLGEAAQAVRQGFDTVLGHPSGVFPSVQIKGPEGP